jgi:hypothetical protein
VTVFEYSRGSTATMSSPQPCTARRVASASRAWRLNTLSSPSSWSIVSASRRPYSKFVAGVYGNQPV